MLTDNGHNVKTLNFVYIYYAHYICIQNLLAFSNVIILTVKNMRNKLLNILYIIIIRTEQL